MTDDPTPLEAVRARIDEIDAALLRLVDERASMPAKVAAAKAAEADFITPGVAAGFGLRPAREAQLIRKLLAMPHPSASSALVVRIWRELMADSLAKQGPFRLVAWGGRDPARTAELARLRFGAAPPLTMLTKPEEALASAKIEGTVAILPLDPGAAWWGRLLAEPALKTFAVLPCLNAWGPPAALAVAAVEVEPSGGDRTLWVTDAPGSVSAVEAGLGECGFVGDLLAEAGGLKLFALAGFVQTDDPRLVNAPGRLKGVIGAAPPPFDL
jgi:chorismate mutase